mgnify:CR=1 FL=1
MSSSPRWKNRPPGSNWGDFGPDDQYGRMNLLTTEKVLQGMQEVRTGRTFNLSLPLDFPGGNVLNPRRQPPVLRPTLRGDKPNMNYQLWCDDPACTDVVCDDLAILHLQYSTQWDSLAHVGSMFDANGDGVPEPVYYNGFRAGSDVVGPSSGSGAGIFGFPEIARESTSTAKALGIEKMSERCVQGRAVMIDLHAHLGRERVRVLRAEGNTLKDVAMLTGYSIRQVISILDTAAELGIVQLDMFNAQASTEPVPRLLANAVA